MSRLFCCDPLVASFCCLWSYDVFGVWSLPFPVTYQLWSLHYMQITTPASVFIVGLNTGSWVRSIVRSDRPALGEQISEFSPQPGSLAVQKIKCHADDSHCQNRNYSETLVENLKLIWLELTHKSQSIITKKGLRKAFFYYYYFWLILYIIFSQILFQCFINSKDCKYE